MLHLFFTQSEEWRFLVTQWDGLSPQPIHCFIPQAARLTILRGLIRHWELAHEEPCPYWSGSLWDIPWLARALQRLRMAPQREIFSELSQWQPDAPPPWSGRDQEAKELFLQMLSPSEGVLTPTAWRELKKLCCDTIMEQGKLPWPLTIYSELGKAPAAIDRLWIPHFTKGTYGAETFVPPTLWQSATTLQMTAAHYNALGEELYPLLGWVQEQGGDVLAIAATGPVVRGKEALSSERPPARDLLSPLRSSSSIAGPASIDSIDGDGWPEVSIVEAAGGASKPLGTAEHKARLTKGLLSDRTRRPVALQDRVYSVSELELYARSPSAYFVRYLLGIAEPEPEDPDLTPAEQGLLVHRVLERFFAKHQSLNLLLKKELEFLQKQRPQLNPLLLERRQAQIQKTLHAFVELERRDAPASSPPLTPSYFEWSFGGPDQSPLIVERAGQAPIRLRGRVDRIDVDHESRLFRVVDYKTGAGRVTETAIESGAALQMPLYLYAVTEQLLHGYRPIGGRYYYLSDLSVRDFLGQNYLEQSLEKVRQLVAAIETGHFSESPA